MDTQRALNLGKYREIVLAVAFFLVFDLAVLVLNFVISFQIGEDAVAINLAGRQRMLSQRMSKAVFDVQNDPRLDSLRELEDTARLFDQTLTAFERGGTTLGGNGQSVTLAAARSPRASEALSTARGSWQLLQPALQKLLAQPDDEAQRQATANLIRLHNPILLKEMNVLTSALEETASGKANRLRLIQTAGILLALGNFLFILFKFIRRLRASDAATEAAQKETQEILATVREGLALVDRDFRLGTQQSNSFGSILGTDVAPGSSLIEVFERLVSPAIATASREYLELLLAGRVKESLVEYLNPLAQVTINEGSKEQRHLSFKFNRVTIGQNELSHLLVTVLDISEQVRLQEALEEAQRNAQKDINLMLKVASAQPEALERYLDQAEQELLIINDHLRELGRRRDNRAFQQMFRRVHALKSEAAALDLPFFVSLAHDLEEPFVRLRRDDQPADEAEKDLLAIPLALESFLQRLGQIRELTGNLKRYEAVAAQLPDLAGGLQNLCLQVSQRQGKLARLQLELPSDDKVPDYLLAPVREIAQQLVRNAVVHGIEEAEVRLAGGKEAAGLIALAFAEEEGDWVLRCRDDGHGIDPEKIRARLLATRMLPEDEIVTMTPMQLVQTIFLPGMTTAEHSDQDGGRGVGLDLVRHEVSKYGGQMRLLSRPGQFTEFIIRFEV